VRSGRSCMKILVLLVALLNVVLFMWEYRQGAFEQVTKDPQQQGGEPIVLVSELRNELLNVDFTSLYPPGFDPRSDNLLTEPFDLEDFPATAPCVALGSCSASSIHGVLPPAFTGMWVMQILNGAKYLSMQSADEPLFSAESQNETNTSPKP